MTCRGLIFLYFVTMTKGLFATTNPHIFVPTSIRAFSYDVAVHVNNATIGQIVELFANNQSEAITAQVITKTSATSTLIFNCGYFFRTGKYFFKLRSSQGEVLSTSTPVTATHWPKIDIIWEKDHRALTTDVKVAFSPVDSVCKSDIARLNGLTLKLQRMENEGENPKNQTENSSQVFPVRKSSETFIPDVFVLPCEAFKQAGKYRTELIMTPSGQSDVTISESDVMNVDWSNEYDLRITKNAFPCHGSGVDVSLSFPPCASSDDQIQLLSVVNGTSTVIDSQSRGNKGHVTFPCSAFYLVNQTVEGFCFKYVVESGHVVRTICQSVSQDSGFRMDGSWSPWTSWTMCNRPCLKTTERRKRVCNNPRSGGSGSICEDGTGKKSFEEVQYDQGEANEKCDETSMTSQMTSFNQKCGCGCFLPVSDSGIVMSSSTSDCPGSRIVIWRVRVPKGHVIRFRLNDYQLANDEMLTVRDGVVSWPLTSQYRSVTSQSSMVIIQWVKSKVTNNLNSCGFILKYEAMNKPTTITWPSTMAGSTNSSLQENGLLGGIDVWFNRNIVDNPVVIGGMAACALIIVVVISVVIIHCKKKRRRIPPGCHTPMNTRLSMPPDGRSCSNDDTESEPMVRPRPIGEGANCDVMTDSCMPMQGTMNSGTAYYLAQRQLELMKRLGKDEHSQTYATGCLTEENLRQQEDILFGDRRSLHKNEELKVT